MKIAILVGTRPEIIKMSPIIDECKKRNIDFILIHSNQHYSEKLDVIFFNELNLPRPHYNLNVGSSSHNIQTASILSGLEPVLQKESPNILLVQGDTNTVLAGALAATKMGIRVGHIEAGLRSYDRDMPEETNRIVADHVSDFLFAVTDVQVQILRNEGIKNNKIFKVGNTIADAVKKNISMAKAQSGILSKINLEPKKYVLFTCHRPQNVDSGEELKKISEILALVKNRVFWPVHYRTKINLEKFDVRLPSNVILGEPVGYVDFLQLISNASKVLTDSGGVQEEACILGVPCITIRENTERPETVTVGANVIVGNDLNLIKSELARAEYDQWESPFGDGRAAERILDILAKTL